MKDCEKEKNEKGRERRERYKAKFLIEIFTYNYKLCIQKFDFYAHLQDFKWLKRLSERSNEINIKLVKRKI